MPEIKTTTAAQGWIEASKYILKNGEKFGGLTEIRNLNIVLTDFSKDLYFDKLFRKVFGDERIDWAKAVTFIEPRNGNYKTLPKNEKKDSYWGRLIEKYGFNQIENSIKKLKEGKNIKTCQMLIFGPQDIRRYMGQPCLLAINCTPRNGDLYITGVIRSNAVSKAGYADYTALVEMGLFLAKKSSMTLKEVTIIAHTAHVRKENQEYKNTLKLLELIGNKKLEAPKKSQRVLINLPYQASTSKYPRYFPYPLNLMSIQKEGDILLDINLACFKKKKADIYAIIDTYIKKLKNKNAEFILNCGDYPPDADKYEFFEYFIQKFNKPVTLYGPYLLFKSRIKGLQKNGFKITEGKIFNNWHAVTIPDAMIEKYPRVGNRLKVNINLTQGCPRRCAMCPTVPIYNQSYTIYPFVEVLMKIYSYYKSGVRFFNFIDDNISASPSRLYKFLTALETMIDKKQMKGVQFQSQEGIEIGALSQLKICKLLKTTNWQEIKVGLENISPEFLKKINKPYANKLHLLNKTLKNIKATDLSVTAYYLLGFNETRKEVMENFKFIAKHKLGLRVNIIRPYEGTKFAKMKFNKHLSDKELRELKSLGYAIAWLGSEKGINAFDRKVFEKILNKFKLNYSHKKGEHIFTGKVYIGFATSKIIKILRLVLGLDSSYKVDHNKEHITFKR